MFVLHPDPRIIFFIIFLIFFLERKDLG